MPNQRSYDTVSEAVNDLVKRGYANNLPLFTQGKETAGKPGQELDPARFQIDEIYRFEGNTDPADETIVYAISAIHEPIKGIVVNGYGIYASYHAQKLVEHLKQKKHEHS